MRLAGEEDLHRPLRVAEQLREPLGLAEEQAGALVRREAAGESDRQRVGIELGCASCAVDELERPVEARGIVPVQPEDERPHDVDPGIVHAPHHLAHGRRVVGPLVEAVDRRLADRLDTQEEIAAATVVGGLQ